MGVGSRKSVSPPCLGLLRSSQFVLLKQFVTCKQIRVSSWDLLEVKELHGGGGPRAMPGLFLLILTASPSCSQNRVKVPLGAGTPLWPTTHQRNTTDKKLERNENTRAEPTPLDWGVRYTQEGSGWPIPGGRTAMSPGRNSFRPACPACGFKQDFRHSLSQSPCPLLRPSWTLHPTWAAAAV